ncbi:MAG: hypothetical protein M3R02_25480 [Chloroflexota bacterium]|nr:hypothetical protein [Chloroflexota bacterium]
MGPSAWAGFALDGIASQLGTATGRWSGFGRATRLPQGPWRRPQLTGDQEALEALPRRDLLSFDVHVAQPPHPEAPKPVPGLGLSEEWLHPDLALAHCLPVCLGRVVAAHLAQIVGEEGTVDGATAVALGAGGLDRAGVAGGGIGPVDHLLLGVLGLRAAQRLPPRAVIPRSSADTGSLVNRSATCALASW